METHIDLELDDDNSKRPQQQQQQQVSRRTLSANVQKLRFMQLSAEKKIDTRTEGFNKPGLKPVWIADEQAFQQLSQCPEELQPKTFTAAYTIEKISIKLQHRLSFHNYNPTVERFQKLIEARTTTTTTTTTNHPYHHHRQGLNETGCG